MNKRIQEEFESPKGLRHLPPSSSPVDDGLDDYEDFDDGNKAQTLWSEGEEAYRDELMSVEDY